MKTFDSIQSDSKVTKASSLVAYLAAFKTLEWTVCAPERYKAIATEGGISVAVLAFVLFVQIALRQIDDERSLHSTTTTTVINSKQPNINAQEKKRGV